jgi:2-polyprenyl-3-methyl-5-hydroxy-6-metoxy-1,4-benzoquinol methylase
MKCRHCESPLSLPLVDLGSSPPSNAYLDEAALRAPEKWFPLRVLVCEQCWLAQTEDFAHARELFDANYAYFSAFSSSWLAHCERYVAMAAERFALGSQSHVVEAAANDGYLLQYVKACGIPCTGIEPTSSTAAAARERGIDVVEEFFGVRLARQLAAQDRQADLMVANNVLAHVPDINDFVAGFATLLKPHGVATFEFPQLLQLLAENQFDTIYHEHFSYLSLTAVQRIFAVSGLRVFDVDTLPTHGGSLRVYAQRRETGKLPRSTRVDEQLAREQQALLLQRKGYAGFQQRAEKVKDDLLAFLLQAKAQDKRVVAYGAAAKGNTLLNFAGIRPDLLPFVLDRNPAKQGHYMPGSRIPILAPEGVLERERPDYVLILPWNLAAEVKAQLAGIADWGGRFVTAVPALTIH